MTKLPFFSSPCPSCSKNNQLPIPLLGHAIACVHCSKSFVAKDRDAESAALEDPLHYWIHFTNHPNSDDEEQFDDKDIARTPR